MSKIFAVIWIHLLCFLGCSTAGETCHKNYCVTLSEFKLRAEAGLCVVIPCTYRVPSEFTPLHIVWYQCDSWGQTCTDTNIIFHSNGEKKKRMASFIGRVSLLEPDMEKMNCSIVINDLAVSDSRSYRVRLIGHINGRTDGFRFQPKSTVKVTELQQTPTLLVPALTEGKQSTLTCVSPSLCSGSDPEITWIWNSDIPGNITLKNMEVTTFKQNSTLTFNSSAKQHGASITCRVRFTGNVMTEKSSTVSVMYMKDIEIIGDASDKEGDTLNLTCTVQSFPPSHITWVKTRNGTRWTGGQDDGSSDLQSNDETTLQEGNGSAVLFIANMTKEHSGRYVCVAKHRIKTLRANVDVAVIYHRRPWMVGNATVRKGEDVNLTCGVESFPPSSIIWTKVGSDLTLLSGQGSQSLLIPEATAEDSGLYSCTVKYLNDTTRLCAEVVVTWISEIQNDSKCELDAAGLLTCVCTSEGFPLPTITWPMLRGHRENSVLTVTSNHTVSSTVTVALKHHNKTTVECISSNDNREARGHLSIHTKLSSNEGHLLLQKISKPEVILVFLIGVLLSTVVFGLAIIGCSLKKKTSRKSDGTVELSSHGDTQISGHLVDEDETVEATGSEDAKEVKYASLDFSKLKKKSPEEAARNREATRTEYSVVRNHVRVEEVEELMEKETETCAPDEENMYSNVKEVMGRENPDSRMEDSYTQWKIIKVMQ